MTAQMKVSRAGVELIKSFEGLRQGAARLPDGRWTIGYGHTFSAREGAKVTPEDAESLLRFDLLPIVDGINTAVRYPLNQNQFDALVSFSFNIGLENFINSTVLKRLNEGHPDQAADAMDSWRSAEFNGQTYVLAPLIRRRAAEKNLFLTPMQMPTSAPSLSVRPVEHDRHLPILESHPGEMEGIIAAPTVATAPEIQQIPATPFRAAEPVSPAIEEVRAKPVIVRTADMAETPAEANLHAASDANDPTLPVMSAAVKAALDMAQREAELKAAQQARMDADAELRRQREADQIEAVRREQERLEQAKLEQERLEQERHERVKREQEKLDEEKREQDRQLQIRLEQDRLEREVQERARVEAARLEQEAREQARIEAERQEAERLELARLEQVRQDQERQEQARLAAQSQEAQRLEAERLEAERLEQIRLSQESLRNEATPVVAHPAPRSDAPNTATNTVPTPVPDNSEAARKAEAAAALMRLYSPYGAQNSGRSLPLNMLTVGADQNPNITAPSPNPLPPQIPPQNFSAPMPQPVPIAPTAPEPEPAPGFEIKPYEDRGLIIDTPDPTHRPPSQIIPPQVIAFPPRGPNANLNANTVQAPAFGQPTLNTPPAPAPILPPQMGRTAAAPASEPLHWRETYNHPIREPEADLDIPEPRFEPNSGVAQYVAPQPAHHTENASFEDHEGWMAPDSRIMIDHEDVPHEEPSFWLMVKKSWGWLLPTFAGLALLGMAVGAYYKSKDPVVQRGGFLEQFTDLTLYLGIGSLVLITFSSFMILKKLSGLRE